MSILFDDNNEEERGEQKLYEFYQVFSAEVRRQLLAKNIPIIQNVYDVLYPTVKNQLLSKNTPTDITIDTNSESIRNAVIAKIIEKNTNLENISEDFRQSLLSRNVLLDSSSDLQRKVDEIRESLLSKNKNHNPNNLDSISNAQRENLLSKNKENLNIDNNIERDNLSFRENNLHKNSSKDGDLSQDSDEFRKNNIHKNVSSDSDLENISKEFRKDNIHRNTGKDDFDKNIKLEQIAEQQRLDDVRKNIENPNANLDKNSEEFRNQNLSNNNIEEVNLEEIGEIHRNSNVGKNNTDDSDLLLDSESIRKQDLSKNVKNDSDLLSDSERLREDGLLKNTKKETSLLDLSEQARIDGLSNNVSKKTDLLSDSIIDRKDDLSKNVISNSDLLSDSEASREKSLSNNIDSSSDLLSVSDNYRVDNESKNISKESDLLKNSEPNREDNLANNLIKKSDLLFDSEVERVDELSKNKSNSSDLLTDSGVVREDNVSNNTPVFTNLEDLSQNPREDLLSKNTPNDSDLLTSGVIPREDLLSVNTPNDSDLLTDSQEFKDGLLAANVPNTTDLLTDSNVFYIDNLSSNVLNTSDLLTDSVPYFADNLSSNVPNTTDLLSDSTDFLQDNISSNIPNSTDLLNDSIPFLQDNISSNVPNTTDLLSDSFPAFQDNISSNVSNSSDLLAESIPLRNDLVAKNVAGDSDLLGDSATFRKDLLAKNPSNDLGVVNEGLGTFSYIGLSKVAAQGLVIRTFLKTKNKPNPKMQFDYANPVVLPDLAMSNNNYVLHKSEYDRSNAKGLTSNLGSDGKTLKSYFDNTLQDDIEKQFGENRFYTEVYSTTLQKKYGISDGEFTNSKTIGGGYFGVNTLNSQGGEFTSIGSPGSIDIFNVKNKGSITDSIRNYNLSRNLYNLNGVQSVTSMSDYINILNSNNDLGFQDLINKTIGAFKTADQSISAQQYGNLIPRGILNSNNFSYLRMSAEKVLRSNEPTDPSQKNAWLANPESMMAKTIAGNPLNEKEFDNGQRGLKLITKTIRNNNNVKMSVNYDPQNTSKYVIGQTGNEIRYSRQRFTIANPHSPNFAKSLNFSLSNYSSGDKIYFPPYVDSFTDSHSANWNEINFLGRPEPVYTYNNSKRDGSITFMVLTDYSEIVLMGREYDTDAMDKIEKSIVGTHFGSKTKFNARDSALSTGDLELKSKEIKESAKEQQDLESANNASNNTATTGATESGGSSQGESAQSQENAKELEKNNLNVNSAINLLAKTENEDIVYELAGLKNKNIYDFMTSDTGRDSDGQLISKPGDTIARLDSMIQNLIFQPAYFSGDKIDYLERMDFLAKLTKPARSAEGSGFSFTSPPVVHIKLGDWWNHDIVVKSVSVDTSDAPWTLDKGRVQPMWAKITLSFDFVGAWGGEGSPVLSTDNGGVYSNRTNK